MTALRHLLDVRSLSRAQLLRILDTAESFAATAGQPVKKLPLLRGKTVVTLFFEPSTRTRTTFELAAKRLSADVLHITAAQSSTTKGESLLDTLKTLEAMHCDLFVVRHAASGAASFIASQVAPHIRVINAGDGRHAHPTQGLLDVFTIRRHKPDFSALTVAIVGDVLHSRVARSDIEALQLLGVGELRLVGPRTLLPREADALGARVFYTLEAGLKDADVVMMLRLQRERMSAGLLPGEHEYFRLYGLTPERLARAKPDAIVLHPGPINRGVEIASAVADGPRSVILEQVSHGVAVRMAVMSLLMSPQPEPAAAPTAGAAA